MVERVKKIEDEKPEKAPREEDVIKPVLEAKAPEDHEEYTLMMFPKDVTILDKGLRHAFKAGVQRVPKHLEKHWYMEHNGVVKAPR